MMVLASRVARKFHGNLKSELLVAIEGALQSLGDLKARLSKFDRILIAARSQSTSLPKGRVWQGPFIRYFKEVESSTEKIYAIDETLNDISLDDPRLAALANAARSEIEIPREAQITYAISDIDFSPHPETGRDEISYSVDRLKEWAKAVEKWIDRARPKLENLKKKAR